MNHLEDIQQNYFEHMKNAFYYGFISFYAGCIFIIHGIFPNKFIYTGSKLINNLALKLNRK